MVFSKAFPRQIKGSSYSVWEEISLTEKEEKEIEEKARRENIELMKQCLKDAKEVGSDKTTEIAISLFDKRASHVVFWKEEKCKEKFDKKFKD
ncbi:hypothetical protein J4413_00565 [Candidatus Woesearchaeota archaeon]|nr:hypothetical protein [Candidatus Woesearchaeota archaeon]